MNEIEFRNWLSQGEKKRKVQGDCVSRLKRIEKELQVDLDDAYKKDNMEELLKLLANRGINDGMKKHGNVNLPIGKPYMSTYSHSVKEYIKFKSEEN